MTRSSCRAIRFGTAFTVAAVVLVSASIAGAAELRWSSPTDPQTMDPHAVSSAPVLGFLNNVYVPLQIQPLLWGSKSNIDLTQRADNFLMLRWITVN